MALMSFMHPVIDHPELQRRVFNSPKDIATVHVSSEPPYSITIPSGPDVIEALLDYIASRHGLTANGLHLQSQYANGPLRTDFVIIRGDVIRAFEDGSCTYLISGGRQLRVHRRCQLTFWA